MVLICLAIRCAFVALLCASSLAMAPDEAGRRDGPPINPEMVPQAQVNPRTIILPVIDGNDIRFTRLSTEDGLSQTMVWQIVQDNQGFMWFGSQYGLNRYDGYKFKVFKHQPGVASSLSGVYIYSLFKDRSGTLWVGCDDFLDKFDPVTGHRDIHARPHRHHGLRRRNGPRNHHQPRPHGCVVAWNQEGPLQIRSI